MNTRGFFLIEVLMGLFLIGLITVSCLPILGTASHQLRLAKDKMDMIFMAESIIERIKSFDYPPNGDDVYIYDMRLADLIETFKEEDPVEVQLPLDAKSSSPRYLCIIYKENMDGALWKIRVEISLPKEANKITDVEIMANMPIPEEDQE
ncbi:MAG: type II secretion system protein [Tissierellia bacterium]|nr:type II secretion system protein [Tissierellia bacterium]